MPNYIDSLLAKVFGNNSKVPVSHRENFDLSPELRDMAERWEDSVDGEALLQKVYKNYHFKKSNISENPQVHLFSSKYANGFAVSFEDPFTSEDFEAMFHTFGSRILNMDYMKVSLDRKIEEKAGKVLETEKYYFKPPLQMPEEGELISQLFGNVAVEKVKVDSEPSYIKVLVTVYSDRLYQDAWDFEDFMDRLLNQEK